MQVRLIVFLYSDFAFLSVSMEMKMAATCTYGCYYCDFSSNSYKSVIEHLCDQHPERWLQYRELELDCKSGKLGLRTRVHERIKPMKLIFP